MQRWPLTSVRMTPGSPRAFSMVEVLLAMFILAIGMIMVMSVFPVGAKWTRDAVDASVEESVARNAVAVIKTHYGPGGNLQGMLDPSNMVVLAPWFYNPGGYFHGPVEAALYSKIPVFEGITLDPPFIVQGVPGLTSIPLNERAYQFGSSTPFPARHPAACAYFWTALCRLDPMHMDADGHVIPAANYTFDLYIIVWHKADVSTLYPYDIGDEVTFTRAPDELMVPSLWYYSYCDQIYSGNLGNRVREEVPTVGYCGIGIQSGTVFRQMLDADQTTKPPVEQRGRAVPPLITGDGNRFSNMHIPEFVIVRGWHHGDRSADVPGIS